MSTESRELERLEIRFERGEDVRLLLKTRRHHGVVPYPALEIV